MKNHKSLTTKTLLSLRDKFKYRLVMSGTPAPNGLIEYWAQMEFISPFILGSSFYGFRNTFFHLERNGRIANARGLVSRGSLAEMFRTGWKYSITSSNKMKLLNRIKPLCSFAKKEDCLDLPEELDEIRSVKLEANQRRKYDEMRRDLIIEIKGHQIAAQIALTKIMKLREITSGFALTDKGSEVVFEVSPKINELGSILEELGNAQAIIWCQFHWEIETIMKKLLGTRCTMYSRTVDTMDSITGFQEGKYQYLIAHPRSAAHGLTFVNCHYQIFFSLDYSWEAHEQARARIHRAGQTKKCTYIYLLAENTIDEQIHDVLKRKGNAQDLIYDRITA